MKVYVIYEVDEDGVSNIYGFSTRGLAQKWMNRNPIGIDRSYEGANRYDGSDADVEPIELEVIEKIDESYQFLYYVDMNRAGKSEIQVGEMDDAEMELDHERLYNKGDFGKIEIWISKVVLAHTPEEALKKVGARIVELVHDGDWVLREDPQQEKGSTVSMPEDMATAAPILGGEEVVVDGGSDREG